MSVICGYFRPRPYYERMMIGAPDDSIRAVFAPGSA
jgi:hypothetical protein